MAKKTILLVALLVAILSLIGCNAAKGLKEDVQFIGDKSLEIVEKD